MKKRQTMASDVQRAGELIFDNNLGFPSRYYGPILCNCLRLPVKGLDISGHTSFVDNWISGLSNAK